MSDALYQAALVALARAAHGAGRLAVAEGSARVDNPLCGDEVTLDVVCAQGRVTGLGHRVRGCLLCEASASWLGEHAIGRSGAELQAAEAVLRALLATGTAVAEPAWSSLQVFAPVHAARSRHRCVLLPFEALDAALRAAHDAAPDAASSP